MRTVTDIARLILAILICQAAGGIGSIATMSSINTWYSTLNKPSFNPPGWVFGPAWGTLYTLMGIAAWLVWNRGLTNPTVRTALILFIVQLALNSLWTFIFFYFHQPGWAFAEIVVLWVMILLTIVWFFKISTWAGALMVPYILWVSFAGVLNFCLWQLNS